MNLHEIFRKTIIILFRHKIMSDSRFLSHITHINYKCVVENVVN